MAASGGDHATAVPWPIQGMDQAEALVDDAGAGPLRPPNCCRGALVGVGGWLWLDGSSQPHVWMRLQKNSHLKRSPTARLPLRSRRRASSGPESCRLSCSELPESRCGTWRWWQSLQLPVEACAPYDPGSKGAGRGDDEDRPWASAASPRLAKPSRVTRAMSCRLRSKNQPTLTSRQTAPRQ
jgi:hypothetical protein